MAVGTLSNAAFDESKKSGPFDPINWSAFRPALFWTRVTSAGDLVIVSTVGPQADATAAISSEYERWVDRCMGWVRRRGPPVWK